MEFLLSPLPSEADVDLQHAVRSARYQYKVYAQQSYVDLKAGKPVVDLLALEETPHRKSLQRQEQRLRKLPTTLADLIARDCVEKWFEKKKEAQFQDHYYRPGADGGSRSQGFAPFAVRKVVNVKDGCGKFEEKEIMTVELGAMGSKPKTGKDRPPSIKLEPQRELAFMEPVLSVTNSSLSTPVPEPTPTITGWEKGDIVHAPRRRTGRLSD